jgi:hypothetical protein
MIFAPSKTAFVMLDREKRVTTQRWRRINKAVHAQNHLGAQVRDRETNGSLCCPI